MRMPMLTVVSVLGLLGGCASTAATDQGSMSHQEMKRHCAMMEQHGGEGAASPQHDPARHGGMSHEEMLRQCQMMREPAAPAVPPSTPARPHQH